jgi:lipopolysaccharide biosynthesis protein
MAEIHPSSAIRIVTSWQDHKAASCLNLKPSIQSQLAGNGNVQARIANYRPGTTWSNQSGSSEKKFALAIHGYHLDALLGILESDLSRRLRDQATLFISLQRGIADSMASYLKENDWAFELIELPNQGRDVLPFTLYQLPRIAELGYRYFAKIHTKKSVHLRSGNSWGDWLGTEIMDAVASGVAEELLDSDESIGLLAPEGSIAPITLHIGRNIGWIQSLTSHLEIPVETLLMTYFVAGTMMIGRVDAVSPLLHLGLTRDNFELESGQLDGTLAHALERMIGAMCISRGFRLESFSPNVYFDAGLGYKKQRQPKD